MIPRGQSFAAALLFACSCVVACGDDESGGDPANDGGAGVGGSAGAGATGGTAGGGSGGIDAAAGAAGSAGGGAAGAAGSDAGEAGTDAPVCQTSYDLGYCGLVSDPKTTSTFIVPPYIGKVKNDCRVAKLIKPQVFDFANKLSAFTFQLWGCPEHEPASLFGLVDAITALSAADADVLIEYYVALTASALSLGPKEQEKLRAALWCLAEPAITNPSTTEHELSLCAADGGADAAIDAPASDAGVDAADSGASDAAPDVNEGGTD